MLLTATKALKFAAATKLAESTDGFSDPTLPLPAYHVISEDFNPSLALTISDLVFDSTNFFPDFMGADDVSNSFLTTDPLIDGWRLAFPRGTVPYEIIPNIPPGPAVAFGIAWTFIGGTFLAGVLKFDQPLTFTDPDSVMFLPSEQFSISFSVMY